MFFFNYLATLGSKTTTLEKPVKYVQSLQLKDLIAVLKIIKL